MGVVVVDISIIIDYYRKTDKSNLVWVTLVRQGYEFAISAITKYEIYSGATQNQLTFWDNILQAVSIIPFDQACVDAAVAINANLKRKRKQIDLGDLFIAATTVTHNLPLATLNRKHVDRVDELTFVE